TRSRGHAGRGPRPGGGGAPSPARGGGSGVRAGARRPVAAAVELRAVRYDVDDAVAVITLDRPERLNAWTARMEFEYAWALTQAAADENVRVVVVTGAGRGFCAGADVKALDRIVEAGDYDEAGPDPPPDVPS